MVQRETTTARLRARAMRLEQSRERRDGVSPLFKEGLGSLLKEYRESADLPQRELGSLVGLLHPAYNIIETGRTAVHAETLFEIATQLNIPIEEIWALWTQCRDEYQATRPNANLAAILETLPPEATSALSTMSHGDLLDLIAKTQSKSARQETPGKSANREATSKKKKAVRKKSTKRG